MDISIDRVTELMQQVHNRCEIFLAVVGKSEIQQFLPTLLEDMLGDCTEITEYCKADEEKHDA